MKVRKAIIPAAGLGTRFLPASKAQPKEMLPLVDKPTIQYIVEEAVASGIEDIIIVTGRGKRAIEDHFDISYELEERLIQKGDTQKLEMVRSISNLANIHYIRQKEPKGLGHAIACAHSFIGNEPFGVLLGDDVIHSEIPCLRQLMEAFDETQSPIIGVKDVPWEDVSKYGIVKPKTNQDYTSRITAVETLVEKPNKNDAPSNLAIMGRYILTPAVFDILENLEPGKNNEVQLTDALEKLNEKSQIYTYNYIGNRYDIGDKLGFIQATIDFALNREDLHEDVKDYLRKKVQSF